jgi:hypothetical protein
MFLRIIYLKAEILGRRLDCMLSFSRLTIRAALHSLIVSLDCRGWKYCLLVLLWEKNTAGWLLILLICSNERGVSLAQIKLALNYKKIHAWLAAFRPYFLQHATVSALWTLHVQLSTVRILSRSPITVRGKKEEEKLSQLSCCTFHAYPGRRWVIALLETKGSRVHKIKSCWYMHVHRQQ